MQNDKIPLLYKDRREEGGTYLRQGQLTQLHLLHVFDAICKANSLSYFLSCGTLLGAMRHNGFIPWDDDLDVGMPYKDYRKFLKVARRYLPDDVILQTGRDVPERLLSFAKLRDAYSFQCESFGGVLTTRNNGIYIDIFPYYEMPNLGRNVSNSLVWLKSRLWMSMRGFRGYGRRGWWQAFVGPALACVAGLSNLALWVFICFLRLLLPAKVLYMDINFGLILPIRKRDLFPLKQHLFEDSMFPVPCNPEAPLVEQYGDWRKIPPENKRHIHGRIILPFNNNGMSGAMDYPKKEYVLK